MDSGGVGDPRAVPPRYGRKIVIPEDELRIREHDVTVQPRRKRRRLKGAIVSAIAIIGIVIAGALLYPMFFSDGENDPEEVFWELIDALNENDGDRLACCSTWYFADDATRDLLVDGWEQNLLGATHTYTVNSYELKTGDYSPSVEEQLDAIITYTETEYGISVVESCVIEANCSVRTYAPFWNIDRVDEGVLVVPLVKVETSWYVGMPPPPEWEVTTSVPE